MSFRRPFVVLLVLGGALLPSATAVAEVNQPPVAVDDVLYVESDGTGSVNVLANDSDPDSDPLSFATVTYFGSNEVMCDWDTAICTYTVLSPPFSGSDSFTYQVSDGQGNLSEATVEVLPAPLPALSISDEEGPESDGGPTGTVLSFEVTLSRPPNATVSVTFQTIDGTAVGGQDFGAHPPTVLSFAPIDPLTKTVEVYLHEDAIGERPEAFSLALSNPGNATIADGTAVGTIIDCTIIGTLANDTLIGTSERDVICGFGGDDLLEPGGGDDVLHGGAGNDTTTYAGAPGSVNVDLEMGTASGWGTHTLFGIESATGGSHDDTLRGSPAANTLVGGGGNDRFEGLAGDDHFDGGEGVDTVGFWTHGIVVDLGAGTAVGLGNDTLAAIENVTGTPGADTISGDLSANVLVGAGGNDTINGRGGDDTLGGGPGTDTVSYAGAPSGITVDLLSGAGSGWGSDALASFERATGGNGADTLLGTDGPNVLLGGGGNDTLDGRAGNDTTNGGSGVDSVTFAGAPGGVKVDLTAGTATGWGTDTVIAVENANGSLYADTLLGSAANNLLQGGGGNDLLKGRAGNDTLNGGPGADTVAFAGAPNGVVVDLAAGSATGWGTDALTSVEGATGSSYGDTLRGNGGANVLNGGAGKDVLDGRAGSDTMNGGSGRDTVTFAGAPNGVTVNLLARSATGWGTDKVAGVEDVIGSRYADNLKGNDSANTIRAGGGSDLLHLGTGGPDLYDGGAGIDTVQMLAGGTVDLATGKATVHDAHAITAVENVSGSSDVDIISGNGGANRLRGNGGNDELYGRNGNDHLDGGAGNDDLDGGAGDDTLIGGTGTLDYASFGGAPGGVNVDLRAGTAAGWGSDTLTGIEGINGGRYNDTLRGNGANNRIYGGTGTNVIYGYGGDDILYGGTGTDTIYGGAGNDRVDGQEGTNRLYGEDGNDVLLGLSGPNHYLHGGSGTDSCKYTGDGPVTFVSCESKTWS